MIAHTSEPNESIAYNFERGSAITQVVKTTPPGTDAKRHNGEGAISIKGSFERPQQKEEFVRALKQKFPGAEAHSFIDGSPSELVISNLTHVGTTLKYVLEDLARADLVSPDEAREAHKELIPSMPPLATGFSSRETKPASHSGRDYKGAEPSIR